MVLKARSENPIKPMRNVGKYQAWHLPSLDPGKAHHFKQPREEEPEEVVPQVEKISEQELEAIKQEAREQGFNQGYQEGLSKGQDEIEKQSVALEMMLQQLQEPLQQVGEKTQQQILQLAFAVARQILRRELQQDPTQLIAIIREAIAQLPAGAQKIVVRLNAADAEIIKTTLNIENASKDSRWQIEADPSLARGDCRIETENSMVDASIEKQVAVIFSRLIGGQRTGESVDDDSQPLS